MPDKFKDVSMQYKTLNNIIISNENKIELTEINRDSLFNTLNIVFNNYNKVLSLKNTNISYHKNINIFVPNSLYDSYIADTNWSTLLSNYNDVKIIKLSEIKTNASYVDFYNDIILHNDEDIFDKNE